ncbi:MAG: 2,3-bisphosphoglycerate-independent phosphoglycerate mutase, partial [Candidatus Ratteibacteria bacterium]
MEKNDLAIRGNFATIDANHIVLDRRAGRISTEENKDLVNRIQEKIKSIKNVQIIIQTVKEHRLAILLRGENLSPDVTENDPQKEGLAIRRITA